MGFGVGTYFDSADLKINGEQVLLGTRFESGSNSDNRSMTLIKRYQIYSDDFVPLCLFQPRKGQIVRYLPDNSPFAFCYAVDSVSIEREGVPIPTGETTVIHVSVRIELSQASGAIPYDPQEPAPMPWELPPYNCKMGTELIEDSVTTYYDATDLDSSGFPILKPFVNTAGVPLQAARTRPLVRITFSFNLQYVYQEWVYQWTGCVNADDVTIIGINFSAGSCKLESLSFEAMSEEREVESVVDGVVVKDHITVNYTKCDVSLLCDPQDDSYGSGVHGFIRRYLNQGAHIVRGDGLHKIWSATATLSHLDSTITALQTRYSNMSAGNTKDLLAETIAALTSEFNSRKAQALINAGATDTMTQTQLNNLYDQVKGNAITIYGTASEMMNFKDPEEVSENMFLNEDGTGVMPVQADGRQIPSFRTGYIDPICNFADIGLPEAPPYSFNFEPAPETTEPET